VKFWIDECLTPRLVGHAHSLGYDATCTRDRGQLGMRDDQLLTLAVAEEFVFVTNNHTDFVGLCASTALHTGLVVLPQGPRDIQLTAFGNAIDYIERVAAETREAPADWMLNHVVEIDELSRDCKDAPLSLQ
jgi:predicted nuclease of predicted toxin-antitoxin system